ncbi:retrovirus-related pol polyprotein, partial [Trifolium medium]|nr:retrovirus-related pol polyprotein [Trifolium medium]
PSRSQWYPDSGATHDVMHSPDYFTDSVSLPGSDHVMLGNEQGLPITSIGSAQFISPLT